MAPTVTLRVRPAGQAHSGRPRRAAGPAKTNLIGTVRPTRMPGRRPSERGRVRSMMRCDRFHCIDRDCHNQPDGHGSAGPTPVRARASPRRRFRCIDCHLPMSGADRTGPAGKPPSVSNRHQLPSPDRRGGTGPPGKPEPRPQSPACPSQLVRVELVRVELAQPTPSAGPRPTPWPVAVIGRPSHAWWGATESESVRNLLRDCCARSNQAGNINFVIICDTNHRERSRHHS